MRREHQVVVPLKLEGGLIGAFEKCAGMKNAFLLDSAITSANNGRYSFAGIDPVHTFSSSGGFVTFDGHTVIDNPRKTLQRLFLLAEKMNNDPYLPFSGGLVGYISFEWSNLCGAGASGLLPDVHFGLYDTVATFDHLEKIAWVAGPSAEKAAEIFTSSAKRDDIYDNYLKPPLEQFSSLNQSVTKDGFINAVNLLKNYPQPMLFANQYASPIYKSPWQTYLKLRNENPSAYSAYINCGDYNILSASRTSLINICGDSISTSPTKGSLSSSKNPDELLNNSEMQSNHRYYVADIIKALNAVCELKSIEAEDVAVVETDARAHHLVSKVRGKRLSNASMLDDILSILPSASGGKDTAGMAFKLEGAERNVYTGTIGYAGGNRAEFNLAFRTMIMKETVGYLHAGTEVTKRTDAEEAYINVNKAAKNIFELVM